MKQQMPKKLKKRWLKALRSGKYKQGKGALYDPKTKAFCCLGVLEHVALDGNVEIYKRDVFDEDEDSAQDYRTVPSLAFEQRFKCEFAIDPLIKMNDGFGGISRHSFTQIADWIETNIEGI